MSSKFLYDIVLSGCIEENALDAAPKCCRFFSI